MTTLDLDPDRAARAAGALQAGSVEVRRDGRRTFTVSSFSGEGTYRVTLAPPSCTCPDAVYNGTEACKHTLAAVLAAALNGGGRK